MEDCLFCKIVRGEISAEKIYEDTKVIAFLDIAPVNKGHTLVVTKKHYANLLEADENALCEIIKTIKKIAPPIMKTVSSPAFNISVNNGKEAGQCISHLHFHIIPRYSTKEFEFPAKKGYAGKEIKDTADRIRKAISG